MKPKKKIFNFSKNNAWTILALLILLSNIGFLIWYVFFQYHSYFHSDSAAKVLLAREIFDQGEYFPSDWNYVNSDLFVLFGHTFIIPLLTFLPAGYLSHAISGLISSILLLIGVWLICELCAINLNRKILIISAIGGGISGFVAENLYGQVSYGTVLYLSLFIVYSAWKIITKTPRTKIAWGAFLFFILLLVFWANPQRALIFYGLPLIFAITAFGIVSSRYHNTRIKITSLAILAMAIFFGVVCGIYAHFYTLDTVNNIQGASHALWLQYDLIIRNIKYTLQGLLTIFNGLPTEGETVASARGGYEAMQALSALVLLALIPISIKKVLKRHNPDLTYLTVFALTAFTMVFFLHITTTIPDMSDPIQSSRYLLPPLIILLIIVLCQPMCFKRSPIFTSSIVFSFAILLSNAYPTYALSYVNSYRDWGQPGQFKPHHQQLSNFLEDHDLRYGYATYWNAGVTSVLSDENVLVRQVAIENGVPMPMRHLSSDKWYRANTWQGPTFLALTRGEAELIDWPTLQSYGVHPTKTLHFNDFSVYIFNANLATKIPGWDNTYSHPTFIPINSRSLSQFNTPSTDDTGDYPDALIAKSTEKGALYFGPYLNVDPGRYAVTFHILATPHEKLQDVVRLDVASDKGEIIHEELTLKESHSDHTIQFEITEKKTMEFRVWTLGNGAVTFKGTTIQRIE